MEKPFFHSCHKPSHGHSTHVEEADLTSSDHLSLCVLAEEVGKTIYSLDVQSLTVILPKTCSKGVFHMG